jgi:hypothetical protein
MRPNVFALSDLERAMEAAGNAGSLELVVVTSQHRNPEGRKFLKKLASLPGVGDVRRRGGDDPVSTTRTKPHRSKERNDDRPQDRNACYAFLEDRASPILICWARNSRKTRIRIGRSPPCPR